MNEPLIITKVYDLILYLIPQVAKFPRQQRYSLGEKIESTVLELLLVLVEARYAKDKAAFLKRADMLLEKTRYCIRLCKDLKIMNLHLYEVLSKQTHEIGSQLGGWMRQQVRA